MYATALANGIDCFMNKRKCEPKKPWRMIQYAGENNPVTSYYIKKPSIIECIYLVQL